MKNLFYLLALIFITKFAYAQTEKKSAEEPEVFTVVEIMPSWKGCEGQGSAEKTDQCTHSKLQEFLARNIKYPANSLEEGVTGTVYVSFIVDPEGKIIQPKVLRGVNDELDEESLRVIALLPEMNPGLQRKKPVHVQYLIPVKYSKK